MKGLHRLGRWVVSAILAYGFIQSIAFLAFRLKLYWLLVLLLPGVPLGILLAIVLPEHWFGSGGTIPGPRVGGAFVLSIYSSGLFYAVLFYFLLRRLEKVLGKTGVSPADQSEDAR